MRGTVFRTRRGWCVRFEHCRSLNHPAMLSRRSRTAAGFCRDSQLRGMYFFLRPQVSWLSNGTSPQSCLLVIFLCPVRTTASHLGSEPVSTRACFKYLNCPGPGSYNESSFRSVSTCNMPWLFSASTCSAQRPQIRGLFQVDMTTTRVFCLINNSFFWLRTLCTCLHD